VEGEPNRFENMARHVAAIPLDGGPASGAAEGRTTGAASAAELGLRPAISTGSGTTGRSATGALKVEVMDPHDLWDARDGLRGRIQVEPAAAVAASAARPVRAALTARTVDAAPDMARTVIQLGAYSSAEAARAAPRDAAAAICRAVEVSDPWCLRGA